MPTPNLKTLRSHLTLSRAQLAAQLDISTETYARHERMDSPPRITLLAVSLLVILAQKSPKPSLSAPPKAIPAPPRDKTREKIAQLAELMPRIAARNGPGAVRDAIALERLILDRRTHFGRAVDAFLEEEITKIDWSAKKDENRY